MRLNQRLQQNSFKLRDYESLYDAPALLDVWRLAEQEQVKGEDLHIWYELNVAKL
jgi:hypothetical protein